MATPRCRSRPLRLTEEETEYNVTAIKHVFDEHVVIQYNCTNTIKEQILEDVTVEIDTAISVRPAAQNSC